MPGTGDLLRELAARVADRPRPLRDGRAQRA